MTEMSIGSNLFQGCRLTAIYDRKLIAEVSGKKYRIRRPIVVGPNAVDEAIRDQGFLRNTVVVGFVFKRPIRVYCAGQTAVLWALRCGYSEVHLWGFDSLWTGGRHTDSDAQWPRSPDLTKAPDGWGKGWNFLFGTYTEAKLKVHLPEGEKVRMGGLNRHFEAVPHALSTLSGT